MKDRAQAFASVSFVTFVALFCSALPAQAELVFFNTGRSMSVKGHRVDGDSLVLELRGGGEIDRKSVV